MGARQLDRPSAELIRRGTAPRPPSLPPIQPSRIRSAGRDWPRRARWRSSVGARRRGCGKRGCVIQPLGTVTQTNHLFTQRAALAHRALRLRRHVACRLTLSARKRCVGRMGQLLSFPQRVPLTAQINSMIAPARGQTSSLPLYVSGFDESTRAAEAVIVNCITPIFKCFGGFPLPKAKHARST